jgi:NAD(P)H dehydrogenase (quinone)
MFTILGATGKVGRTTIAALRQAGAPVRAVVRDASRAGCLVDLGCEIAVADLQDAHALTAALQGSSTVQVICPISPQGDDAARDMLRSIDAIGTALEATSPTSVLAISDYGAEIAEGTGVTVLFHHLEERLRQLRARLTLVRSAEHMENWFRVTQAAAQTGMLPSLHHPLDKRFPTVSAFDLGGIAAELLLAPADGQDSPRVIHVEGPRRYTALDVAEAVSALLGRDVTAYALPRPEWRATLARGGLGESYIGLVTELYDAHNAGLIDARPGTDDIRHGRTDLVDALRRAAAN